MNKRFLLTTAAVVALSTSAFAQSPSAPSSSAPSSSPSAAQQRHDAPSAQAPAASGRTDASGQAGGSASSGSATHDASKDSSTAASRPSQDAPKSAGTDAGAGAKTATDKTATDKTATDKPAAGKADTANDASTDSRTRSGDKAEGRSGATDPRTRDSASDERARRGDDRQNAGQRPDRDRDRDSADRRDRDNDDRGSRDSADRRDRDGDRNGRERDTADRSSVDVKGSVRIDDRQRTRISQSISRLDVRPLTNVNFSVSVGVVVPRGVDLRPLPAEIVEIVPQYRGYDFVLVRDEIVIVEPSSHKIVTVLPYSGKTTASTSSRTKFTERDRDVIRKHAKARPSGRQTTVGSGVRTEIRMGERLPDDVEIEAFPEEVYREVPTLREYRYIDRGNRIYIVEPGDRRIIEEID